MFFLVLTFPLFVDLPIFHDPEDCEDSEAEGDDGPSSYGVHIIFGLERGIYAVFSFVYDWEDNVETYKEGFSAGMQGHPMGE